MKKGKLRSAFAVAAAVVSAVVLGACGTNSVKGAYVTGLSNYDNHVTVATGSDGKSFKTIYCHAVDVSTDDGDSYNTWAGKNSSLTSYDVYEPMVVFNGSADKKDAALLAALQRAKANHVAVNFTLETRTNACGDKFGNAVAKVSFATKP